MDPIRKLSRLTEAAFARAEIAEVETANLRTKYVKKKARAGPGGRKKFTKGTIADWGRSEERGKLWLQEPKQRPRERAESKSMLRAAHC